MPEDLALAGFDDVVPLRDVVPGLTTVRLPMSEMGAAAAGLALDGEDTRRTHVRGEVVLRGSTERT